MDLLAPLGPVYQAGTLSGNPLAMAAGIAALELLDESPPYARLDALGRRVADALAGACRAKGIAAQVPQAGSMFCIFFTGSPVRDYAGALRGDAALYARFFRGCLDAGVYLPPSAYETAFLSTAHEGAAVDRACEVMASVIRPVFELSPMRTGKFHCRRSQDGPHAPDPLPDGVRRRLGRRPAAPPVTSCPSRRSGPARRARCGRSSRDVSRSHSRSR